MANKDANAALEEADDENERAKNKVQSFDSGDAAVGQDDKGHS